jgi:hypothetical protein
MQKIKDVAHFHRRSLISKEDWSKEDWSKEDWRADKLDSNARQVPTIAGAMPSQRHRRLEHDPEKWIPVFRKDHAQIDR